MTRVSAWRDRFRLANPSLGAALVHGSGLAIRLGFTFALLRVSGPALLGRYGLLASIEVVAIYLAGFELHAFTTRRYARAPGPIRAAICLATHRRTFLLSVPLAMGGAAIAAMAFGLHLGAVEFAAFMAVIATGVVAQDLMRFVIILRGPMHAAAIGFIRTASWQPATIMLATMVAPLRGIVIGWAIAGTISVAWGLWMLGAATFVPVRVRPRYLFAGLWTARRFYLMASASVLQGNLERFVLQASMGAEAVGVFVFFQNMANALPTLIQVSVHNAALPSLLTHFGQKRPDRFALLRRVLCQTLRACAAIAMATIIGATFILLYMPDVQQVRYFWILPALLIAQSLQSWSQPFYLALFAAHRDRPIMWLSLSLLALSLLFCVALVKLMGLTGAVASQMAAGVAILIARRMMLRRYVGKGML